MEKTQAHKDIESLMETINWLVIKVQKQLVSLNYNGHTKIKKCGYTIPLDIEVERTHEHISFQWAKCDLVLGHSEDHEFKAMIKPFSDLESNQNEPIRRNRNEI